MTFKFGKYTITLTLRKVQNQPLTAYPTITEIMSKYQCSWDEARNRLTGYHLERHAQARKAITA